MSAIVEVSAPSVEGNHGDSGMAFYYEPFGGNHRIQVKVHIAGLSPSIPGAPQEDNLFHYSSEAYLDNRFADGLS